MTAIENMISSSTPGFDRFVREAERRQITSLSRSQAWKLEKEGLFPPRIKLGSRSVVWKLSDLLKWLDEQSNTSTEKPL
ncbi:helix-turn-helix transcriptional regulator [Vibrio natriegens]|uniref:helix-turn-helix transcriptional regulator n=1 Tax=Vibrio natriegens TaxID=691 RepID=UPI00390AF863